MANIKVIQFLFILSEMSKEFKVHEDFNLEHLSWDEENCHCDKPGTKKEAKYLNCESSKHLAILYINETS